MNSVVNRNVKTINKTLTSGISIVITILIILIGLNIGFYFLKKCDVKKNLLSYLMDFSFSPCLVDSSDPSTPYALRKLEDEEEVFHISNQDYTYDQAKCKCAAYGARLATKGEIIKSYNKGGDWCSYGWSEGQTAYYPTQKCSWDKLQKGPKKHRDDCGMPGVNGGFFVNPFLKFGANCYGVKPKGTAAIEKDPVCDKKPFCERKSNSQSASKLESDVIAPFKEGQWSQF